MNLLKLLLAETTLNVRVVLFMAAVAGLSNAFVLAVINAAAGNAGGHGAGFRLALMFVLVIVLYTVSQLYLMSTTAKETEAILHRVRTRLVTALMNTELPEVERIGRTRIYAGVSQEIQYLAQSSNVMVMLAQMSILVVFTTLYLASISLTSFVLAVVFMGAAIAIYLGRARRLQRLTEEANGAEAHLQDLLGGVLGGFKEIKLNARRREMLLEDVLAASELAGERRAEAKLGFGGNFVFTQNTFFLLLGTMVFIVPALSAVAAPAIVKTTTAVLFIFGPISGIISSIPLFVNADASAARLIELEKMLAESDKATPLAEVPQRLGFGTIELRGVTFSFANGADHPFTVGPIDLLLNAGETVFISGGNGSGKSTFLRLLTALYRPQLGMIFLDGVPVNDANLADYRSLFSAVFSDYHLFRRLYGIDAAAVGEGPDLLELFELSEKTRIDSDAFTTIDLSAGQRKRLALIVAILERRPVCVLDEWAADQDPAFRRTFYQQLLAMLKARGITVIAVSHDDRYFDHCDRHLHMEEGRISEVDLAAPHA